MQCADKRFLHNRRIFLYFLFVHMLFGCDIAKATNLIGSEAEQMFGVTTHAWRSETNPGDNLAAVTIHAWRPETSPGDNLAALTTHAWRPETSPGDNLAALTTHAWRPETNPGDNLAAVTTHAWRPETSSGDNLAALGANSKSGPRPSVALGRPLATGWAGNFANAVPDNEQFEPGEMKRVNITSSRTQTSIIGNNDIDNTKTSVDHTPLECNGSEILQGSLDTICGEFHHAWSCKHRCSQAIRTPCSCDVNCLLHNTCCLDFEENCPDVAVSSRDEMARFPGLHTICDPYILSPLVSYCPESASEEAKRLCRIDRHNASSVLDLAPVSDSFYLWSFRNKHCWRCWNTGHQALRWFVNVSMSFSNRMSDDYRLDSLTSFMANNQDKVLWYPPKGIVKGQCSDKVVSHCSICGVDNVTMDRCVHGPHAYVQTVSGVYKNMYCYMCSKHTMFEANELCIQNEVETITMHGLNFPVTMILPDGDDTNDVKLIQDKLVYGGFYWDEMSCSLLGGTCQAKLCMPSTLVYNGRCDQGVTPMAFNMRVCLAEVVENDQKCRPLQGKLNVLMHADLKEVLNYVISYTEVLFKMYEAENNSLLESSVSYSEDYGIQISALWRLPFLYDIKPAMVKQSRFDLMSIVESHISTTGWLAVCFRWGTTRMTSTYSMDGNSCELSLSCPPQELAEKDWSSNAASLNRPSLHAANFLWLPGVLLMAL